MLLEAINRIEVGAVIVEERRAGRVNRRAVAILKLRAIGTRKVIGEQLCRKEVGVEKMLGRARTPVPTPPCIHPSHPRSPKVA